MPAASTQPHIPFILCNSKEANMGPRGQPRWDAQWKSNPQSGAKVMIQACLCTRPKGRGGRGVMPNGRWGSYTRVSESWHPIATASPAASLQQRVCVMHVASCHLWFGRCCRDACSEWARGSASSQSMHQACATLAANAPIEQCELPSRQHGAMRRTQPSQGKRVAGQHVPRTRPMRYQA